MSKNIIQLNEEAVKGELKELVRKSVEETLNELLDTEERRSLREQRATSATKPVRATAAYITAASSALPPGM